MNCAEARDLLEEYRRGELRPDAVPPVEAHLAACAACRGLSADAAAVAALVRSLGHTPAPSGLARRVRRLGRERRGPGRWLGRPWVAAAVSAAVVALALAPWLQFRAPRPADSLEVLIQSSVAEHRRVLLQLRGLPPGVSDPAAAFALVRDRTSVELPRAFAGGGDHTLLAARPTVLANRKAAEVVLQDPESGITTYFALPGRDLPMPAPERRVQIEQYRPYLTEVNEFRLIYWKQGDLAYVMVSDVDQARIKQLYLRMRKAL